VPRIAGGRFETVACVRDVDLNDFDRVKAEFSALLGSPRCDPSGINKQTMVDDDSTGNDSGRLRLTGSRRC
jgi:hypothetical protein